MTVDIAKIQSLKELDPDTLSAVFDHYAPAIYKYAFRLCWDAVEADQIVGDVFSTLLEQVAAGRGPDTNLRSYLYQSAYHLIVDHARERNRIAPLDENATERNGNSLVSQTENRILLDALASAINNDLTDEQRQVITLRFQEGFSLQETARIVGRNLNAVKALENRGVKKLRQILEKTQEEGPAKRAGVEKFDQQRSQSLLPSPTNRTPGRLLRAGRKQQVQHQRFLASYSSTALGSLNRDA